MSKRCSGIVAATILSLFLVRSAGGQSAAGPPPTSAADYVVLAVHPPDSDLKSEKASHARTAGLQ